MVNKDYYELLGVSKSASLDEIKKSYRRLARHYHPDVNKEAGSQDRFKEITEAYAILSDPDKRAQYDRFGSAGPGFGGAGGFGGFEGFDVGDIFGRGFEDMGGLGDLFESFLGGGRRTQRKGGAQAGDDLRYDLVISLEEAYAGIEKHLELVHLGACSNCKGTGAKPGTKPIKCNTCKGLGRITHTQQTILGNFAQVVTCPTCHGAGETISSPCPECSGNGRTKARHKISVKIPAGIDSGYRLRVGQAGNAGIKGGPPGDLYVFIEVEPHNLFEREGDDLRYKTSISFVKATLGTTIDIPTLKEKFELKIPAGTQSHTTFKLKGKGMPRLRGSGSGDLYVLVKVETPTNLSKEQVEQLKKFDSLRGENK